MTKDFQISIKNEYCFTASPDNAAQSTSDAMECKQDLDVYSLDVKTTLDAPLNFSFSAPSARHYRYTTNKSYTPHEPNPTPMDISPTTMNLGNTVGAFLVSSALQASGIYDK